MRVPEDLLRFWMGHADKSVTNGYSKINEDRAFRNACADETGLGFELSAQVAEPNPEVCPVVPKLSCLQELYELFRLRKKWRTQGDDLRTFLSEFVSALPQVALSVGVGTQATD
jgi:hypothetical protein